MQETITIYAPGAIPGIPGELAPGTYIIDWDARIATPVQPEPEEEPEDPE